MFGCPVPTLSYKSNIKFCGVISIRGFWFQRQCSLVNDVSANIHNFIGILNLLILLIDEIYETLEFKNNSESIVDPQSIGFKRCLFDILEPFFSISRSEEGNQTFSNSWPYVINVRWRHLYQSTCNLKHRKNDSSWKCG